MSDNPLGIIDPGSSTEGQKALDETPLPSVLTAAMNQGATVGYVQKYVETHYRWCPAMRMLRRWSIFACVLLGILLALNSVGWLSAKAVFVVAVREGVHAELKETVRGEVREALKEMGIIHARLQEIERERHESSTDWASKLVTK